MATTIAIGLGYGFAGLLFWLVTRSVVTSKRGRFNAVGVGAAAFLIVALVWPYGFVDYTVFFAICATVGWIIAFLIDQLPKRG